MKFISISTAAKQIFLKNKNVKPAPLLDSCMQNFKEKFHKKGLTKAAKTPLEQSGNRQKSTRAALLFFYQIQKYS